MLSDVGSIASILGLVVSLLGLGFAILQIRKLRGETRAAREAAEETRRSVSRDLAMSDISRMDERIQVLIEMHRRGEWGRALDTYPEIRRGLIEIRNRYPELSGDDAGYLQTGIQQLQEMEYAVDIAGEDISQETLSRFNQQLSDIQLKLAELGIKLQQFT